MSDKRWTVAGKRGSWGNPEHLLWPDDQDPDLPHKFTASHMGEAWPDTSDSIVDAAFVALVDAVKSAALMAATGQTYKGVSWESDHPTCVLIRELENQEEQG